MEYFEDFAAFKKVTSEDLDRLKTTGFVVAPSPSPVLLSSSIKAATPSAKQNAKSSDGQAKQKNTMQHFLAKSETPSSPQTEVATTKQKTAASPRAPKNDPILSHPAMSAKPGTSDDAGKDDRFVELALGKLEPSGLKTWNGKKVYTFFKTSTPERHFVRNCNGERPGRILIAVIDVAANTATTFLSISKKADGTVSYSHSIPADQWSKALPNSLGMFSDTPDPTLKHHLLREKDKTFPGVPTYFTKFTTVEEFSDIAKRFSGKALKLKKPKTTTKPVASSSTEFDVSHTKRKRRDSESTGFDDDDDEKDENSDDSEGSLRDFIVHTDEEEEEEEEAEE
jgi:hypothetical protein